MATFVIVTVDPDALEYPNRVDSAGLTILQNSIEGDFSKHKLVKEGLKAYAVSVKIGDAYKTLSINEETAVTKEMISEMLDDADVIETKSDGTTVTKATVLSTHYDAIDKKYVTRDGYLRGAIISKDNFALVEAADKNGRFIRVPFGV